MTVERPDTPGARARGLEGPRLTDLPAASRWAHSDGQSPLQADAPPTAQIRLNGHAAASARPRERGKRSPQEQRAPEGAVEAQLRIPPHSIEAESSVLGALLLENGTWEHVGDLLTDGDFYRYEHKLIYAAVGGLIKDSRPADVITVFERLQNLGQAEEVGGLAYLNGLAQYVPSAANIRHYAEIVRERSTQRRLVVASDALAAAAFSPEGRRVGDILQDAQHQLAALSAAVLVPAIARAEPRALDFASLRHTRAPARTWFVQHWLGSGGIYLGGAGGSGKSSLVQHQVTLGALGRPYIGQQDEPFTSLVWNCEDEHDELWRRQERICDYENIQMADLQDGLHIVSRYGCENALMVETRDGLATTSLMKELREQVNDLRVDALWLDNAAHLFLGNHDDRTHVTSFINALNGLVTGRPFAAVIVAHPGKAQASEYSGSVAWENAVRMRWYLGSRLPDQPIEADDETDRTTVRYLCKRKANYSAADYVRFSMQHGLLVPDAIAQDRVGGLVSALDEKRAEEICLAGFRSLKAMGLHPSDSKASPDYLPRQLLEKRLASGYSKGDLAKAMNRLMTAGKFSRGEVAKYTNRSPRMGLLLAEGAL